MAFSSTTENRKPGQLQKPRKATDLLNTSQGPLGTLGPENAMEKRQSTYESSGGIDNQGQRTSFNTEGGPNNLQADMPNYTASRGPLDLPQNTQMLLNRGPVGTGMQPEQPNYIQGASPYQVAPPAAPPMAEGANTRPRFAVNPEGVDANRKIGQNKEFNQPMGRQIQANSQGGYNPTAAADPAMADYTSRVSSALEAMNSDVRRSDRYEGLLGMAAPPPDPRAVADSELDNMGFWGRLGQFGMGLVRGLPGGLPGILAGGVAGATGDMYRAQRVPQLQAQDARTRQATQDRFQIFKQQDTSDLAQERLANQAQRNEDLRLQGIERQENLGKLTEATVNLKNSQGELNRMREEYIPIKQSFEVLKESNKERDRFEKNRRALEYAKSKNLRTSQDIEGNVTVFDITSDEGRGAVRNRIPGVGRKGYAGEQYELSRSREARTEKKAQVEEKATELEGKNRARRVEQKVKEKEETYKIQNKDPKTGKEPPITARRRKQWQDEAIKETDAEMEKGGIKEKIKDRATKRVEGISGKGKKKEKKKETPSEGPVRVAPVPEGTRIGVGAGAGINLRPGAAPRRLF